jgi:hypothetical protein
MPPELSLSRPARLKTRSLCWQFISLLKFKPLAYVLYRFGPDTAYSLQIVTIAKGRKAPIPCAEILAVSHYRLRSAKSYARQSHQAARRRLIRINPFMQGRRLRTCRPKRPANRKENTNQNTKTARQNERKRLYPPLSPVQLPERICDCHESGLPQLLTGRK